MRAVTIIGRVGLFGATALGLAIAAGSGSSGAQTVRLADSSTNIRAARHRVLFNRYQTPMMTVFIADADGKNERALLPGDGLKYSPSYSVDGQWVIFTGERDGQADVYRIHPDGTSLQQLTDDPAFDDQGVLSPDGKTLAFVSTRGGGTANLWLMDLGSKATTKLTSGRSGNFRPSWSPDGRWIAFTSDRDSQPGYFPGQWEHLQSTGVYIIAPDGKSLRRLTKKDGVAGSPAWSADGRQVLFYETDEVGAYLAKNGNARTEIVSIDVATGARKQYTASNETKLSPAFLPDGKISYIKRAGDETGGLRIWHPSRRVETVIRGAVRNARWSPDAARVVYERISRFGSPQHLVPTFSRDPDFELFLSEPFAAFSPDGKKLLYSQYGAGKSQATGLENSNTQNTSIEIMNADGTGKRTLFHRDGFSAFSAVWAPAGDEIALSVGRYFRAAGLPPAQIALVKPDGSDFRVIVDDEVNNGFPSWSPDGSRLVFKRGRQLVIMGLADRRTTPLTDGAHYDNFPQWSPKGDAIMFTSDRDGDFELYTIRPDGTGLRRLTDVPGNDAHSTWCAAGEWIVFSSGRMGFKDEMALYDAVPQPYGEIFAMRADGSDVRQLTDNKWEDSSAVCSPVEVRPVGVTANRAAAGKTWTPPRTPDGRPDLQGIWLSNSATPLERPKALEGKQFLTDEEVAVLKARAERLFKTGDSDSDFAGGDAVFLAALANVERYKGPGSTENSVGMIAREFDNRTSLIIDPPEGRIPPQTTEARERQAAIASARPRFADGPEAFSNAYRCITTGVPKLGGLYGAGHFGYYQIVQTSEYVAIVTETIHDARIVPLDGRAHLPPSVALWNGDSRGRWEGNTLVVDTRNFSPKSNFMGSTDKLHLIERFTRVAADTINYEITLDDPATWTKPWTAMIPLKQTTDNMYEFACHEGNRPMLGMLAAARADEKAAGEAK